jgi:TolA-binding protein
MKIYIIVCLIGIGAFYGYEKYSGQMTPLEAALDHAKKKPDPVWSPRIQYWVGMIYYQRSEFPQAQATFNALLTDYPTCHYAPDGLIKLNLAAQENKDWETAKAALARYVEEYPKEKQIDMARKSLEQLRYNHP